MSKQRVLVVSNGSLLMASVLRLLQRVEELAVERVTLDEPGALARIGQFAPQVVVLDTGGAPAASSLTARMLSMLPGARIIALNLDRTDIEVYPTEQVTEASLNGLLEAIRGKRHGTRIRITEPADETNVGRNEGEVRQTKARC